MPRRRKPQRSPEELAAIEREREENRAEVRRLKAQPDVRVVVAPSGGVHIAQRMDVFQLLLTRKRGAKRDLPPALGEKPYDAIRRLEKAIHAATGVRGTSSEVREHIDGSSCGVEGVTQGMLEAGREVRRLFTILRDRKQAELALALLSPHHQGNALTRWRPTVERVTGWRDEAKQVDTIVKLAEAVLAAYVAYDYGIAHNPLTETRRTA